MSIYANVLENTHPHAHVHTRTNTHTHIQSSDHYPLDVMENGKCDMFYLSANEGMGNFPKLTFKSCCGTVGICSFHDWQLCSIWTLPVSGLRASCVPLLMVEVLMGVVVLWRVVIILSAIFLYLVLFLYQMSLLVFIIFSKPGFYFFLKAI